jgi:predicted dehydrogenase
VAITAAATEALPVRLAIVGCGAMSDLGHLPALRRTDAIVPTILIDQDEGRARHLAHKFGVPHHSTRLADAAKHAEAACVVVPHHVHTSVACDLIGDGLHMLIEKPLAVTLPLCDPIIEAADKQRSILAVAMVRRFARTTRLLKQMIAQGTFGATRSFRLVNGTSGTWPTKSTYVLNVEQSGGGVLMSNGVHDIDLLACLFGHPVELSFFADADFLGAKRLENDAFIKMTTKSGITGTMELSRTRDLTSGLWIEFERADIFSPLFGDKITVTLPGGVPISLMAHLNDAKAPGAVAQTFNDMLTEQLVDFASAVRNGTAPAVDGREGRSAIETVMRCYANVQPLDLPWRRPVLVPEAA